MATILGYTSLSEALQAIKVSFELEFNEETSSYRPRVYAPMYVNKEYMLDLWFSSNISMEDIRASVEHHLAYRYDIRKETVWTSS